MVPNTLLDQKHTKILGAGVIWQKRKMISVWIKIVFNCKSIVNACKMPSSWANYTGFSQNNFKYPAGSETYQKVRCRARFLKKERWFYVEQKSTFNFLAGDHSKNGYETALSWTNDFKFLQTTQEWSISLIWVRIITIIGRFQENAEPFLVASLYLTVSTFWK